MDPLLIDFHLFRKLAEEGRAAAGQGDHSTAKSLLGRALSLWQGRPLEDLSGAWAEHCRNQMEIFERVPAYYSLFESQLELREHLEVMSGTGMIRQEHELDEIFAFQHMQALNGLGKYPHALEFHSQFCERLFDVMGAEPGPELRDLYQEVLRRQAGTGVVAPEPPKAEPSRPQQLPRATRRFAGRSSILAELDALLEPTEGEQGQVVVLHGMPGVGKTRLAVHWAHLRRDLFPDGQVFLDLRGHGPGTPIVPSDALGILLTSVGFPPGGPPLTAEERRVELGRILRDRRVLVVLDNAENSNQVRPLLGALGDCFTIVTSRTRPWGLKILDNVHAIGVPPLSPAESIELLRNEIGPGRAAEDPDALQELATRSDGHPLGLRIIAQHVAHRPQTTVADLVEEFKDQEGLGILGSSEDSDDENATLPVAFSWSYRALSPATARAFRLLGMHPTTEFSTSATAALLDEDERVVDAHLRTLAKVNLLQHSTMKRYRLHDLLHGYAVDLVRHEELPENRKRALKALLDWYWLSSTSAAEVLSPDSPVPPLDDLSAVTPLRFDDESEALEWFTKESSNLIAAIAHAIRHGHPGHSWRLSAQLHELLDREGRYSELVSCHLTALKAARLTSEEAQSGTLNNLGNAYIRLRDYPEAIYHLKAGLTIAERLGMREMQAICVHNLASAHLAQNEVGKAIAMYEQALRLLRELGFRGGEASTLDQMANAYRKVERDDLALELHRGALEIRVEIKHLRGQATTHTELGKILHEHGEHEQARTHLEAALELHRLSKDRVRNSEALVTIADVYYNLGLLDRSIASAELAVAQAVEIDSPQDQVKALHVQGHALALLGNVEAAGDRWRRAVGLLDGRESPELATLLSHIDALERTRDAVPDPRNPAGSLNPTRCAE
ncbi:ATP-binding protein [Umezawaea sp. NPDC059074]|uniref:ATP-binding protein n=1 Tax=Umezawaea sp. NPDC059074 TaxID=3346716 RepID=UPI00368379E3